MCTQLHVWLATCVVGYMCGWQNVWLATCVVGHLCGRLHDYDLLTTEVSFMRGYTGDESGMDGYRYRTSIAILHQQLTRGATQLVTCSHVSVVTWEHMGMYGSVFRTLYQDDLYQMFRSLTC